MSYTWTEQTTGIAQPQQWTAIASSSDGTKLVACVRNISPVPSFIFTSIDS
jgi:hypothetical protein